MLRLPETSGKASIIVLASQVADAEGASLVLGLPHPAATQCYGSHHSTVLVIITFVCFLPDVWRIRAESRYWIFLLIFFQVSTSVLSITRDCRQPMTISTYTDKNQDFFLHTIPNKITYKLDTEIAHNPFALVKNAPPTTLATPLV